MLVAEWRAVTVEDAHNGFSWRAGGVVVPVARVERAIRPSGRLLLRTAGCRGIPAVRGPADIRYRAVQRAANRRRYRSLRSTGRAPAGAAGPAARDPAAG